MKRSGYKVSFPYTLTRKRIYILPTRYGFLFVMVLFGMLTGSVNYNNNPGFLLTFLLGGITFISILHTHRNLSGIIILSVESAPVFAGEKAGFKTMIALSDNKKRFSIRMGFAKGEKIEADINPGNLNQLNIFFKTKKRGVLNPGLIVISTKYPLGLFRAWSKFDPDVTALVYPKPVYDLFMPSHIILSSGRDDKGKKITDGGTDDFSGLKAYQPGDSLLHISWKAFSKGQGLMTKKFGTYAGTSVWFDYKKIPGRDMEIKLSMICAMILTAASKGMDYGLKLPGLEIEPGKGEAHKHNCLKALAQI